MGRKVAAQRPGGAQAGTGTGGRSSHPEEHTCVYMCAWANMQDHTARDPALHPKPDAHRGLGGSGLGHLWLMTEASLERRFTVTPVGSGPLQRPPVP